MWLANRRRQSAKRRELERTNPLIAPFLPRVADGGAEHGPNGFRPQIFDFGLPFAPLFTELLIAFVGVLLAECEAGFLPPIRADNAFL